MEVPNSHLPLGSLRGWLLATGECRWKSAKKSGLASNRRGIWMQCLKAEVGGTAVAAPPAESPDSLTLTYLGLAPSLEPGQDILGSDAAHWMMSTVHPWTKPCGQRRRRTQQVDVPCLCPKFVPGLPNLTCPGAPLFAAADPSRPKLHPGCPKYLMVWPAVPLLAKNSSTSHPQHYSARRGQDPKVQTKPHSQSHAISVKDLQTFAQSQVLLDLSC